MKEANCRSYRCVHVLFSDSTRNLYVVPVFSKDGKLTFEVEPVIKMIICDPVNVHCDALAAAITETAEHSAMASRHSEPVNRWNGDGRAAWLQSSFMITIEWKNDMICVEEALPVKTDDYPLPGFERVKKWRLRSSVSNYELAECILLDFISPT